MVLSPFGISGVLINNWTNTWTLKAAMLRRGQHKHVRAGDAAGTNDDAGESLWLCVNAILLLIMKLRLGRLRCDCAQHHQASDAAVEQLQSIPQVAWLQCIC